MKKHTPKLLAILLVICMIVGLIPAIMASGIPQTLYLKPCSDWFVDSARFAAYFWNASGSNAWADATDSDGDGCYEVTVPDNMTNVLFARMNGSTTANNWDNKWNQTVDQTIPTDGNNCFVMDSGWNGTGAWTTHGDVPIVTEPSASTDPTIPDIDATVSDIQDGMTLHCWNWSYADIEKNMALIASQGYTAVQTSPIQQAKEDTAGKKMSTNWWVYYQPMGFHIDQTAGSALGTKDEFISMCNTAHEYGVKVIVDVVANHLGNQTGNDLAATIIDDLRNDPSCWHDISTNTTNYSDRYNITQYCMGGLPDLNTASDKVQSYVLSFLKECIDAGADGFRFDGAKHIETPEDQGCASDFWPTVIGGATEYAAATRNIDLYCYGEILYAPDEAGSLPISAYTKYMSVTDNSWGNSLRGSVNGGNADGYNYAYHKNANANKLVLWAESHDTYANEGSGNVSSQNVNKTWALIAARADAMGLYFARPSNYSTQKLGEGSVTAWSYPEVKAVNQFHNLFVGTTEYLAKENGIAYCERGGTGVVLVNCSGTGTSVSVTAHTMAEGTYIDTITGNAFTVSGGKISGQIGSTGIAVVYSGEPPCTHPSHDTNGTCSECGGKASHSYVNGLCTICGAELPPITEIYYLFGWINGANYACEEDYTNLGQYKLVNGTLTTTFAEDSYVAVKSADNSSWYMTDGWQGFVNSATLYNTATLGTTANKLYVPGGVEVIFTLTDNGNNTFTLSYVRSDEVHYHSYAATVTAPTCTETGCTTYTCACGDSYTADEVAATGHSYVGGICTVCGAEEPGNVTLTGSGFSLSFEDEILVNFYYTAENTAGMTEQGMLVFHSNPGEADIAMADDVYTDSVTDGSVFMNTTKGIAAKYMGDERYYCAYAKRSDGTYAYSPLYSYSPKQYATNMLGKDSTSAAQKALCVAMLNYGAAAQNYFGYNTDDLMNASLPAEQQALVAAYDPTLFTGAVSADAAKTVSFTKNADAFTSLSATVSFEGAFAINYYFAPSAAVNGDLTLYYWTPEAYAAADSLTVDNASGSMAMVTSGDGSYWGQVSGIAAKQLDETYYVAAVYTDEAGNSCCTGVIAYSLSRYCMNNDSGNMGELAANTAMYGYYAKAYFNQQFLFSNPMQM